MGMNHMQRMRALEDLTDVIAPDHIAGGQVKRRLTIGSRIVRRGEILTREELLQIPAANLKAMIAGRDIDLKFGAVE